MKLTFTGNRRVPALAAFALTSAALLTASGCATTETARREVGPQDLSAPSRLGGGFDVMQTVDDIYLVSMQAGRTKSEAKYRVLGGLRPTAEERFCRIYAMADREAAFTKFREMRREFLGRGQTFGASIAMLGAAWIYSEWNMTEEGRAELEAARKGLPPEYPLVALVAGDLELTASENAEDAREAAEREYSKVLADYPSSIHVTIQLARLYERKGRDAEAIAQYESALKASPNVFVFWRRLAELQQGLGLTDEAINSYTQALKVDGTDATIFIQLGMLHEKKEQLREAAKAYTQAARLRPREVDAWRRIVAVYKQLGDREAELDALENLLKLDGANEDMLLRSGELALELGQFGRAKRVYDQMLSVNPTSARAFYGVGLYYDTQGDMRNALFNYIESRKHDSNFEPAERAYNKIRAKFNAGTPITAKTPELVFQKFQQAALKLYNKRLKDNPNLRGKIILALSIDASGAVKGVSIKEDTLNDQTLELTMYIMGSELKFNEGPFNVEFPFSFKPGK